MYERQRLAMVRKYVVDAGVSDNRILRAMSELPRHLFVDPAIAAQAYNGRSLPIGYGQTISHPTTVARMTQALNLEGGEKILEIGTGSGYQAAVLAKMGAKVYTVERIYELTLRCRKIFEKLHLDSIAVKYGDGTLGWPKFGPYDRIIITAAAPDIPSPLIKQLKDGGILISPVGPKNRQTLQILKKIEDEIQITVGKEQRFVPLIGNRGWQD